MRPLVVLGALTVAAAALSLGACGNEEAEARPTQHETGGEEESPLGEVPARDQTAEPLTPGEDGVIEPDEGQVLMPAEVVPEEEGHPASDVVRMPRTNDPTTPDARDQLERDRVEEGRPQ